MRHARSPRMFASGTGLSCLAAASLIAGLGCRQDGFFSPPGPILRQQSQAIINDPFPLDDIAPSDAGSRPPGFQTPLPEAVRNRIHRDSTVGFNR